ncbi:Lrp/AsnC family transcriptional regulator [Thalassotalea sp. ND16A]|uniref:Lrp/AsnC family transcriptional regulator n=1 Tax=Thalassotalea sp. ND16A TaxID=1535422 RepID=UPI00051A0DF7|nr:AsnC family transcriptional regulator [Thalassotalea sp. ND16A]KGJ88068.1 putative transcriptional regulator, AsnC family [Thalassotalea sp. ND16A]
MDALDRKILNRTQLGIPVSDQPFADIANELGCDEQQVIDKLQTMLDDGLLTRFGPMFDAASLGGAFTLSAMIVPEERFGEVNDIVNAFSQVAHNYKRQHTLNMWFVVACESQQEIQTVIADIEQQSGLQVFDFPKQEEFYVGLYLPV